MPRDWTPDELDIIEATPGTVPRTSKIDVETVKAIRRKTDSLKVAWTLRELAEEFGLSISQMHRIALRLQWKERAHEPHKWWRSE